MMRRFSRSPSMILTGCLLLVKSIDDVRGDPFETDGYREGARGLRRKRPSSPEPRQGRPDSVQFSKRSLTTNLTISISPIASTFPSMKPSPILSVGPSSEPSSRPSTEMPTSSPSDSPTYSPSHIPSKNPTTLPSNIPSNNPSVWPSRIPTASPSNNPSELPTSLPSETPTNLPSQIPTLLHSLDPSNYPSSIPTTLPSSFPSAYPSITPSLLPSDIPSLNPTISFLPSFSPSFEPTSTLRPSYSPSSIPTSQPSSNPSSTPSVIPTVSSFPSAAPHAYVRTDRVDIRYTPWTRLGEKTKAVARRLGYNNKNWDKYGTNPIEDLRWSELTTGQLDDAILMGYDQKSWDCWQNHFLAYNWADLELPQVLQFWDSLGWDESSWNSYSESPESDSKYWYELTEDERRSASQICYFRRNWDDPDPTSHDFPIEKPSFRFVHWSDLKDNVRDIAQDGLKYSRLTWNVIGLDQIEARQWTSLTSVEVGRVEEIGFTQQSWDCWMNHFKSYSWSDLSFYGLDLHFSALGWSLSSWEGFEGPPPSERKSWSQLTECEKLNAAELCFFEDSWDKIDMTPNYGPFPFPKPKLRYVSWSELPYDDRNMAKNYLLYNETTWDNPGLAAVEETIWDDLLEWQKAVAIELGYYQRTWDCFQNHYQGYRWRDLSEDIQSALADLGWSKESWRRKADPPALFSKEWSVLRESERASAAVICYFEDNWIGTNLIDNTENVIAKDLLDAIDEDNTDIDGNIRADSIYLDYSGITDSVDAMIGPEKPTLNSSSIICARGFLCTFATFIFWICSDFVFR